MRYYILKDGTFKDVAFKSSDTYHELFGVLTNITFKPTLAYGDIMKLHFSNDTVCFQISLFVKSGVGQTFLMLVSNIQLDSPFTIKVKREEMKDILRIYQHGKKIEWFTNFPGYGGCLPKLQDERSQYLISYVQKNIIPILQNLQQNKTMHEQHQHIQSGYFDEYKSGAKMIQTMCREEKYDPNFGRS